MRASPWSSLRCAIGSEDLGIPPGILQGEISPWMDHLKDLSFGAQPLGSIFGGSASIISVGVCTFFFFVLRRITFAVVHDRIADSFSSSFSDATDATAPQ